MFLCVKALYIFPFFPNQLVFLCSTLSVQVRLASSSGSDQSWSRVQRSDWWPSILLVRHSLAASCTIFHVFMKFMSYSNAQLLVWKDVAGRLASVKLSEGIFQLPLSGICHFVTNSDRRKTPKWKGKECSFYPNMPILPCGSLNCVQQGCGDSTSVGWRNRARISINSINDTHCFIPDGHSLQVTTICPKLCPWIVTDAHGGESLKVLGSSSRDSHLWSLWEAWDVMGSIDMFPRVLSQAWQSMNAWKDDQISVKFEVI